MFATFPQLLFLAPLSALLIRVSLALIFAYSAWHHAHKHNALILSILEVCLAGLLVVGAWTQPIGLVSVVPIILMLSASSHRTLPKSTLFLSLILCLSLVVTGAGAFAFDLPL